MGRRNPFMNNGPLNIPRDNVIKSDNTIKSLVQLISKPKTSYMDLYEDWKNLEKHLERLERRDDDK